MCASVLVESGCSKRESVQAPLSSPAATAEPSETPADAIDVCAFLTPEEIQATQGASLKSTKKSARSDAGLTISQCYFALPNIADSIVVTVTQRSTGSNGREPKQAWNDMLSRKKGDAADRKDEQEMAKPEEISGLGDAAFWVTRRFGGKLYVLKGDRYITVGVGSAGDEALKIKRSKAIAEILLKKL